VNQIAQSCSKAALTIFGKGLVAMYQQAGY